MQIKVSAAFGRHLLDPEQNRDHRKRHVGPSFLFLNVATPTADNEVPALKHVDARRMVRDKPT